MTYRTKFNIIAQFTYGITIKIINLSTQFRGFITELFIFFSLIEFKVKWKKLKSRDTIPDIAYGIRMLRNIFYALLCN